MDDLTNLANLSSKNTYKKLINKNTISNTAYTRWREETNQLHIEDQQKWSQTCVRPFTSIRETKIQSFQYKVINRITPCHAFLKQIRVFETDECPYCQATDTISHFFLECPNTLAFWENIYRWTSCIEDLHMDSLSEKETLLGVPFNRPKSKTINTLLFLVKYYMHRQKLFHSGELSLIQWLQEFKARLQRKMDPCQTGYHSEIFLLAKIPSLFIVSLLLLRLEGWPDMAFQFFYYLRPIHFSIIFDVEEPKSSHFNATN